MDTPALQSPSSVTLGRTHKIMESQFPHLQNGCESTYSVGLFGGLKEIIDIKVLQKSENIVPTGDIILMTISFLQH